MIFVFENIISPFLRQDINQKTTEGLLKKDTLETEIFVFLREILRCHWNISKNLVKDARINNSGINVHRSMKLIHNIDMYGTHHISKFHLFYPKDAIGTSKNAAKSMVHIHPNNSGQAL